MSKTATIALAATFAASIIGGSAPAKAEESLTLSTAAAVGSLTDRFAGTFNDLVDAADVDLGINYVAGTALGSAGQVMDQTISGAVDVMGNDMAWVAGFHPDLSVLNWSYAFSGPEHLNAFFQSDVFAEIVDEIAAETGVRVLAAAPTQPRYFHSRVAITSAEDMAGLKVRVPQIRVFIDSWEAMGTVPTPLNFSEVFIAMNTGVIDGAFGNPSATYPNNFHVSGPNVITTADTTSSVALFINEARWQSLAAEQRAALRDAAQSAVEWAYAEGTAEMESVLDQMRAEGATISDIDTTPLREAALERGRELEAEGLWTAGLLDRLQEIAPDS